MIPVAQEILGPPKGDCFRACVASILELDIDELPNYHGYNWWYRWVAWGKARGLDFCCYASADRPREAEYWIAGPRSPRIDGVTHAVVMKGDELVWDPHPAADPEHPCDISTSEDAIVIWSVTACLCCQCGTVTPERDWTYWQSADDEAPDWNGEEWRPSLPGEGDPMMRCPTCSWEHRDTDDCSGVYIGTFAEMRAQREADLPELGESWAAHLASEGRGRT